MGQSNNIISRSSYAETLKAVIDVIRARKVDLDVKHILFVPDKYTLYAEQMLYNGTSGAFDAEVLTLNRLFSRIADGGEYLSKQGAVMLMRKIIAQNADKLTCFGRSSGFLGFGEKIYSTVAQLASCNILPPSLAYSSGALSRKLGDISLLYQRYIEQTDGKFVDSCGRMELLKSALDVTHYFDNAVVYFANFDAYTPQTQVVINKICEKAKASYIGMLNFDTSFKRDALVYEARDLADELKFIARQIRNAAIDGVKYSDMCVVAENISYELLKRIFGEFDIPFYIDKKYILAEHPLAQYMKLIISAIEKGDRFAYIMLAKNFYSGVDKKDSDIFENYCNKYCVDFGGFSESFTKGASEAGDAVAARDNLRLEVAENTRKNINAKIRTAAKLYEKINTAEDLVEFIEKILQFTEAEEKSEELERLQNGISWGDVCEKLRNNANTLKSIYGSQRESRKTLIDAYFDGLAATKISLIPNMSDCIIVGRDEIFRGMTYKTIFILGFDESYPRVMTDCGIITDREIESLKGEGLNVEPKISDINERARIDALSLMQAAENIVASYSLPSRVSFLIGNLCVKKVTREEILTDIADSCDADFLARNVSSAGYARELLASGISRRKKGYGGLNCESELRSALGSDFRFMQNGVRAPTFLGEGRKIFFRNPSTTISQIQEYFMCPYRHFLTYGLKLAERETGELSPLDIGNFLHKVIELFVSRGQYEDIPGEVKRIVSQIIGGDDKYHAMANEAIIKQISIEAEKIADIVVYQIHAGYMKPLGQEMHFGSGENKLKTLYAPVSGGIYLSGIIDRVDIFDNDVRVVDYKTGHVMFKFSDLYYGVKIQLMLYMKIMIENGYKPAGMFYFPFSTSWSDNDYSHRLLGVFNNDITVAMEMDKELENTGAKSKVFEAETNVNLDDEGNIVLRKCSHGFSEQELASLSEYAYKVLVCGAKEIEAGNISPSPIESNYTPACEYCKMSSVCVYNSFSAPVRETVPIASDIIIDSVK